MLRFLFFLFTIVVVWYVLDAVLKSMRVVFGGRRPHQRVPEDERSREPEKKPAVEMRDVKDAEFRDLPPEKPKGTE